MLHSDVMKKELLRVSYRTKRSNLTASQRLMLTQQITRHFFADWRIQGYVAKPNAIVHTYLPIARQHEADTWPLIHKLWRDCPNVRIWSSITESTNHSLRHFQLAPDTLLTETKWGIPAPTQDVERVDGLPDLVVVPLLAVDQAGNRVGYGGGYYDRFLAETGLHCLKVGLSMFDPVSRIDDIEPTDVRLDGCVTPTQVHWFF